jgi:lipocalin
MFRKEWTMKKFNQDYKITISGDMNGNAYWVLLRKGEPAACNEDEIRMVAQVLGELKEKIDKQYPPNGKV